MSKLIDLTGKQFGRLTVVSRAENDKRGNARWLCRCDCGNYSVVMGKHLRCGHTESCGCSHQEVAQKNLTILNAKTDGRSKTRLYRIWVGMLRRCTYEKQDSFPNYGARGIVVCPEWSKFEAFAAWAFESGYQDSLSIDRIDVNGGYYPSNCKWSTAKEQQRNTRYNRNIGFQGKIQSLSAWAEELEINVRTLWGRLNRGWSIERALTEPIHTEFRQK